LGISAGTLDANSKDITISGNFSNSALFIPSTGTVIFNDATKTTLISGSTTFYNFYCNTAGKTLYFEAGKTKTINGPNLFDVVKLLGRKIVNTLFR